MTGLDVHTARRLVLMVAGVYLLLVGAVELAQATEATDAITADELVQSLTTLASLTVGTVIGYFLASGLRKS